MDIQSYTYRKSHCVNKMFSFRCYLHFWIFCIGIFTLVSSYRNMPLVFNDIGRVMEVQLARLPAFAIKWHYPHAANWIFVCFGWHWIFLSIYQQLSSKDTGVSGLSLWNYEPVIEMFVKFLDMTVCLTLHFPVLSCLKSHSLWQLTEETTSITQASSMTTVVERLAS